MSKRLVAYFSVSGVTKQVAEELAAIADADLHEIAPAVPYQQADLNWMNPKSRSTVEMKDPSSRPAIGTSVSDMEQYSTVYVGFPIWWYVAPTIINTFLEHYDFSGKTVVLFATSGGSGFGKTAEKLKTSVSENVKLVEGAVFRGRWSRQDLERLVNTDQR